MKRWRFVPTRMLTTMALVFLASGTDGTSATQDRLQVGVFLRCTGHDDPAKAMKAVKALGIDLINVSKLPDRFYTPEGAREFVGLLKQTKVRAGSVVIVFDGESYKDREAVEKTVGFRPLELLPKRMAYAKRVVDFTSAIGTKIVAFHMGFLPNNPNDPIYKSMLQSTGDLARYAATKGVTVALETGQETAENLMQFLGKISPVRVGVNFDTANLILYGMDSPPEALKRLLNRVTSIHVKDGLPPEDPRLLGREVRLGEGRAGVRECLQILRDAHFQGPVIIENYVAAKTPNADPLDEIRKAKAFIEAGAPVMN